MFEPPKILGDVFESMVGAVFIDGGIEKVIQVLEPLLAPFTLFIAKFNKRLYREPKDEFQQVSALVKITPKWSSYEVEVSDTVDGFMHALSTREDPKELYRVGGASATNQTPVYKLTKCEILYNNGQVLCVGFGSSKKQAERNASIRGCEWLRNQQV